MTNETVINPEITQDDRLWAALAWIPITPLWPIFAIVALLIEDKKERQFIRYHAVLSLATGVVLIPLTIVTCGCAAIIIFCIFLLGIPGLPGTDCEYPNSHRFC